MAADSRTTWSTSEREGSTERTTVGIHFSDTANKLFLCGNRFGVSTCGDASVQGRSIATWMDGFQYEEFADEESIASVANKLGRFFAGLHPRKMIEFHVVGYEQVEGSRVLSFCSVYVKDDGGYEVSGPARGCGANWGGETATLSRLIKDCFIADASEYRSADDLTVVTIRDGAEAREHLGGVTILSPGVRHYSEANIQWRSFTLQEAIDFAIYAVRTTIATLRFQSRPVTVGEPIDVLVVKPNEVFWLSKKELHL